MRARSFLLMAMAAIAAAASILAGTAEITAPIVQAAPPTTPATAPLVLSLPAAAEVNTAAPCCPASVSAATSEPLAFAAAGQVTEPGQLLQLPIRGLGPDAVKKAATTVFPREKVTFYAVTLWGGDPALMFCAKQPGQYLVGVYSINASGAVAKAETIITVTGGVDPPNPPGPGPVPPTPDKTRKIHKGKLWLICIVPSLTQLTGNQAAIEKSQPLRSLLDASGNHFRLADAQTAPTDLAGYLPLAKSNATGFIVDQDKKAIAETFPLVDEADTIARVKKWEE